MFLWMQAGRKKSLNLLLNWHYLSCSTMKQKRRMSPFTCAICSLIHIFYAFLWLHSLRRLPFLIHSSKTYCNLLLLLQWRHWVKIIQGAQKREKRDTENVAISHFVVLFYGEMRMKGSTAHYSNINSTLTSKWAYQSRERSQRCSLIFYAANASACSFQLNWHNSHHHHGVD